MNAGPIDSRSETDLEYQQAILQDVSRTFALTIPALPEPLKPLLDIAQNLWWTWQPEAVGLFWRIDRDLWQSTRHNPIALLGRCAQDRLDELAADDAYVGCIQRLHEQMHAHMSRRSWFHRQHSDARDCCIAYFSAEFGLTESLQVYSGGLGILAGIVAQKFDQMAAITNFVVTPLSFLSGTFYSIERLPEAMQIATHFNPIFYLIDGVRFGMIGASDSSPWLGLIVCLMSCAVVCGVSWYWLRTGYRLKP